MTGLDPEGDYGTTAAWCADADDLEDAKRRTHDGLLGMMGDQRTGGVQWIIREGDAARALLGQLWQGADEELSTYYRQLRGHLREYGGYLVVAIAPGRKP